LLLALQKGAHEEQKEVKAAPCMDAKQVRGCPTSWPLAMTSKVTTLRGQEGCMHINEGRPQFKHQIGTFALR